MRVSNNVSHQLLSIAILLSKLSTWHIPAAAQCVMASGEHGSGRFGGVSSGKSDVWKYFDKSTDGKKAKEHARQTPDSATAMFI